MSACGALRYLGGFENDEFHGRGMFHLDSSTYVGDFACGKRHGKGINYSKSDGGTVDLEIGYFKDGKLVDGHNSYLHSSGFRCESEIADGSKTGFGKLELLHGAVYVGEIKNFKFHGLGTYVTSDGTTLSGEFSDGDLLGDGSIRDEDGKYR